MSTIASILTGGLFQGVSQLINTIRGKSPEDAAKLADLAAKYNEELLAADVAMRQAQSDTNKAEATNPNWFVSSWRPAVGWCCALGLFSQFIIAPFATWIAALYNRPIQFPSLDMGTLLTLLLGLLGLAGARTYEKVSGVSDDHPLK